MRNAIPPLLTALAVACGPAGNDAGDPGAAVMDHLAAIAPLAVVADSFHIIDVAAAEGDTVRFRTVWAFEDTSGVWVDTSNVLTAVVAPDERGLRVAGYDAELATHVVELVDEDRRRRYEDLLDAVHHVYHAILEADWYYKPDGIDPAALRARVEAGGHDMQHPWDITPITPGVAQVIWLADAADTASACALPITDGEGRAQGFEWVQDRQWFTCRGRTPDVYSRAAIPLEVRDVLRAGSVMPAAPPPASRTTATHRHD